MMIRLIWSGLAVAMMLLTAGGCLPEPTPSVPTDLTVKAEASATTTQKGAKVLLTTTLLSDQTWSGSVTYDWSQTYGREVTIKDPNRAETSFAAPSLPEWMTDEGRTLKFRVDVTTSKGVIPSNVVQVVVEGDSDYIRVTDPLASTDPNAATVVWEEQVLESGRAELAKSESTLAQEFADLVEKGVDAAGNKLQETESGLQYVVVTQGTGATPQADDTVRVHYSGWFFDDGASFDSSFRRGDPSTFAVGGVIEGWTEGLQLMRVQSHYRLVILGELAYGEAGSPPKIPPNATLVFDVYLMGIEE